MYDHQRTPTLPVKEKVKCGGGYCVHHLTVLIDPKVAEPICEMFPIHHHARIQRKRATSVIRFLRPLTNLRVSNRLINFFQRKCEIVAR